jgi:hypothetical protein
MFINFFLINFFDTMSEKYEKKKLLILSMIDLATYVLKIK